MNEVYEGDYTHLVIIIANNIRDIGIKQLRYSKKCILIGNGVTKEDVLNIK